MAGSDPHVKNEDLNIAGTGTGTGTHFIQLKCGFNYSTGINRQLYSSGFTSQFVFID
jgi:hypothetical protein